MNSKMNKRSFKIRITRSYEQILNAKYFFLVKVLKSYIWDKLNSNKGIYVQDIVLQLWTHSVRSCAWGVYKGFSHSYSRCCLHFFFNKMKFIGRNNMSKPWPADMKCYINVGDSTIKKLIHMYIVQCTS